MTDLELRALDARVAQEIMGLTPEQWPPPCPHYHNTDGAEYDAYIGWSGWCYTCQEAISAVPGEPPHYTTDIAAAWLVVEVMERRGYWCQMRTPFADGDGYWAGFTPHSTTGWNGKPDHWTSAASLPLALCRAALAAVENTE